jgi:hypothetical protein
MVGLVGKSAGEGADTMAQWEDLKTDGERIQWLSENLSAVMGMLHRATEQINALQQRVQVLEEEIEKLIGLPLRDVP